MWLHQKHNPRALSVATVLHTHQQSCQSIFCFFIQAPFTDVAIWGTNTASIPPKSAVLQIVNGVVQLVRDTNVVWDTSGSSQPGPFRGVTLHHQYGWPSALTEEGSTVTLTDPSGTDLVC